MSTWEDLARLYATAAPTELFRSEWVMSSKTAHRVRLVKDPIGRYVFVPPLTIADPYEGYLLDLPVRIDESADGVSLVPSRTECACDLIDVSTASEIRFVRGRSRGCTIHPPSEWEKQQMQADAAHEARVAAAMKVAREAAA